MPERKSIFISMGRPYTDAQTRFRDNLIEYVRQSGLEPRVINVTDYPPGNPLKGIAEVQKQCSGAIVVASERTYFPEGIERRNSDSSKALTESRYTTPWSQIESTMAFTLGLPILVLAELGIKEEGLLEEKYDWYIERVALDGNAMNDASLRNRLNAWFKEIPSAKYVAGHRASAITEETTLRDLLGSLSIKAASQILLIAGSLIAAGATFGAYFRQFPNP